MFGANCVVNIQLATISGNTTNCKCALLDRSKNAFESRDLLKRVIRYRPYLVSYILQQYVGKSQIKHDVSGADSCQHLQGNRLLWRGPQMVLPVDIYKHFFIYIYGFADFLERFWTNKNSVYVVQL